MMVEANSGPMPMVTAPPTCPCFPGFAAPSTSTVLALACGLQGLPALLVQLHRLAQGRMGASRGVIPAHTGRGPPDSVQS